MNGKLGQLSKMILLWGYEEAPLFLKERTLIVRLTIVGVFGVISLHLALPSILSGEVAIGLIGSIFGTVYFYQQHRLSTMSYFQNVFDQFNRRYDELHTKLDGIRSRNNGELEVEDKLVLKKYFNLCAEEYLQYSQGFVPEVVWRSWVAGMSEYFEIRAINELWMMEQEKGSYYGFDPANVIKGSNSTKNRQAVDAGDRKMAV